MAQREAQPRKTQGLDRLGIGWGLSLIVIGIALYNLFATRHADRPELIAVDARLFINQQETPHELVAFTWNNMGKRAARAGTASLFTIARDGTRHEKFGYSEITAGANNPSFTTITPPFGIGYAAIPVDMQKFSSLFLVCVKYRDDTDNRYKQKFVFELGPHLAETVTRLDELSSSTYRDSICRG